MRRLASHYIWYKQVYRLHYIEVDDDGGFVGVFPLKEEIAGTSFHDGVLVPLLSTDDTNTPDSIKNWKNITKQIERGMVIHIYQLSGIDGTAAKFGTYNSGSHSNIKRL